MNGVGALAIGSLLVLAAACGEDEPAAGACPPENTECREAATAEDGLKAVGRRRCESCHTGPAGKMAGINTPLGGQSEGVELYPPNLTPHETGIGAWTDDQLANAIRTGIDRHSLALCPQMKHDATMSDFEVYSIVKYLRSLPPIENKIPRSVCPPLKTKDEQPIGR